jgi:hypothetical protein
LKKSHFLYILCLFFLSVTSISFAQHLVIDSLKRVLSVAKIDSAKVNVYNAIAHAYRESNPDSTNFYAAKAQQLAYKNQYVFGLANAHLNKGNAQIIFSNYPEALQNFVKAQQYFEQLSDANSEIDQARIKNGLARSYASAGVVYS